MICENLAFDVDGICPDCDHHWLAHRMTTKVCDACAHDAARGPIDGRYIISFPTEAFPEHSREKACKIIMDHFKRQAQQRGLTEDALPLIMFGGEITQVVE